MDSLRPNPRYLDAITAVFITALLTSNIVASKTASFFGQVIGVGVFVFPISYIFGDILTEVYGYQASRRVIWLGFSAAALAAVVFLLCDLAPPAPGYPHQAAFHAILGQSPLVLAASLIAYLAGEFCNSYVLARMKIWTAGRHLWARTIGSTIVGEGIDSLVFYPLAFRLLPALTGFAAGLWPWPLVGAVMLNNYLMKLLVETLCTPLTYHIVARLKRSEDLDVYDHETNFNPFRWRYSTERTEPPTP